MMLLRLKGIGFAKFRAYLNELHLCTQDREEFEILAAIHKITEEGHVCTPETDMVDEVERHLAPVVIPRDVIQAWVNRLLRSDVLVQHHEETYESHLFQREDTIVRFLKRVLYKERDQPFLVDLDSNLQEQAINMFANEPIGVLSGFAGTGKTFVISHGVAQAVKAGESVIVLAPTGKAVSVLNHKIRDCLQKLDLPFEGIDVSTIHRYICIKKFHSDDEKSVQSVKSKFAKNASTAGLCIVDEMSMVDMETFASLVELIPDDCRVMLCGDPNQLPPVGSGQVFRDIVESFMFPHVHLTRIMRQSGTLCDNLARFLQPPTRLAFDDHLQQVSIPPPEQIVVFLNHFFPEWKDTISEHLFLAFANRTCDLYAPVIRQAYLAHFGQAVPDFSFKSVSNFAVHDRVMCTKNTRITLKRDKKGKSGKDDDEVFIANGTCGFVESINERTQSLLIRWDGESNVVQHCDVSDIRLSYMMTVHKSQGSQAKNVLFLMPTSFPPPTRNLVYTAISRAQETCMVACSLREFEKSRTRPEQRRRTNLFDRLLSEIPDISSDEEDDA
jgi:exodeoxyribonuclease V alpha subunit